MRGAKTVSPASMAYWQSIGRGRRALQPRGWTSRASLIPTCCSAHRPRILVTRRTESRRRRQKRDRFTRSSAANVWRHAFPHASALVHRPARMIRCSLVSGRIAEPDGDGVIPCAARRASRSASRSAEGMRQRLAIQLRLDRQGILRIRIGCRTGWSGDTQYTMCTATLPAGLSARASPLLKSCRARIVSLVKRSRIK